MTTMIESHTSATHETGAFLAPNYWAGSTFSGAPEASTPAPELPLQEIGGYKVHPATSLFPLAAGPELDDLIASIERRGQREPVVFQGDLLLKGRRRVLAVRALQERGVPIELQRIEWQPLGDETPAEFIADVNFQRRDLTPDQRAMIAAEMVPIIAAEQAVAQARTRIKPGEVRNPGGRNGKAGMAAPVSAPPAKRASREKDSRSTVGRVATAAKTSKHKARLAIVATRTAAPDDIAAVKAGTKKLSEVATESRPRRKRLRFGSPILPRHPFRPCDAFEESVLRDWIRMVTKKRSAEQKARVRSIVRRILEIEEAAKDSKKQRTA